MTKSTTIHTTTAPAQDTYNPALKYQSSQHKQLKATLELLHKVARYLTPGRYYQWGIAVDSRGYKVGALAKEAHRFSLLGAMAKCAPYDSQAYDHLLTELCKAIHPFGHAPKQPVSGSLVTRLQMLQTWTEHKGALGEVRALVARVQKDLLARLQDSPVTVVPAPGQEVQKKYLVQVRSNPKNKYSNFITHGVFKNQEDATEIASKHEERIGKGNVRVKIEHWVSVSKLAKEEYLK